MLLYTAEENVKEVKESEVNSLVTAIHFDRKIFSFPHLSLKQKMSFYVY